MLRLAGPVLWPPTATLATFPTKSENGVAKEGSSQNLFGGKKWVQRTRYSFVASSLGRLLEGHEW